MVVAVEPITDIDVTGEMLRNLDSGSAPTASKARVRRALKDPVRDWLRRYEVHELIGDERFFPTIGVAVAATVAETGVSGSTGRTTRPPAERRGRARLERER